jgi:hypothetical protein
LDLAAVEFAFKHGITYREVRERFAHPPANAPVLPNLAPHGVTLPDRDQLATCRKSCGGEMVLKYERLARRVDYQRRLDVVGDDEAPHGGRVADALGQPDPPAVLSVSPPVMSEGLDVAAPTGFGGSRPANGTHIGDQNGPTSVKGSIGSTFAGRPVPLLLFLGRLVASVRPPGETESGSAATQPDKGSPG